MDAIIGVWLSSVLGAGAFSAAGYVLGQRGVVVPGLFLPQPPPPTASEAPRAARSEPKLPDAAKSGPALEATVVRDMSQESLPGDATPTPPAFPAAALALALRDDEEDEERPTVIPKKSDHAKLMAAVATIPPPRPASIRIGGDDDGALRKAEAELAATRKELREARERADRATSQSSAAEAKSLELERQLDAVRSEHRHEVASRATAAARAEELGDRLATASEDAASLRHKVSNLERQMKQLREALQGRVRALTTSEWHRRREIEDAEEVQKKLRDVYEKLERSSMPPTPAAPSVAPIAPSPATAPMTVPDADEVARLRAENERLRGQVLGSLAPKARPSSRGSAPEIDIDAYRAMLERVSMIDGVRGAVVADELGSLVLGTGELAEGLAAFGAYIRDASERTERLLPIGVIDEIALKDKTGAMLHTRILAEQPATLSFVVLGAGEYAVKGASKLVEEHLRDRI